MDERGIERSSAMGTESLTGLILRFSLPGIVGMVANALYNIVDRIFVGRAVDPMGIGAIAVGFPFMMLVIAFSTLIGVGAGSLVSISLGERRRSRAERAMGNALLLLAGGGVLATVVGSLFIEEILTLSGVTPTLMPMAREYLGIVVWGIPLSALGFGLNYFIRAEGSPRFAMFGLVLGAVMNILLDALFIFTFRMGIGGAALATVLSQGITALWSAWYYLARMGELRFRPRNLIPSPDVLGRIFAVGLAPFLTELSFTFVLILFNRLLRRYGGDMAVSAMGIFFSLDSLFFLPVLGLAGGVQPIIGYNFGARNYERVIRAVKIALVAEEQVAPPADDHEGHALLAGEGHEAGDLLLRPRLGEDVGRAADPPGAVPRQGLREGKGPHVRPAYSFDPAHATDRLSSEEGRRDPVPPPRTAGERSFRPSVTPRGGTSRPEWSRTRRRRRRTALCPPGPVGRPPWSSSGR